MANELKTNDAALSLHSEKKMEETNKPIRKEIFLTISYIVGLSSIPLSATDDFFGEDI